MTTGITSGIIRQNDGISSALSPQSTQPPQPILKQCTFCVLQVAFKNTIDFFLPHHRKEFAARITKVEMSQAGWRLKQGGDGIPHPSQLLLMSSSRPPLPTTTHEIIIVLCYSCFKCSLFPPLQPKTVSPIVLVLEVYMT